MGMEWEMKNVIMIERYFISSGASGGECWVVSCSEGCPAVA